MSEHFFNRKLILSQLLIFGSLLFLRHQLVVDTGGSYATAFEFGVYLGWLYDIAAILFVVGIGYLLHAVRTPLRLAHTLMYFLLFTFTVANVLYFRFFEGKLQLWMVEYYITDVFESRDSIGALWAQWPIFIAAFLSLVAIGFIWRREDRFSPSAALQIAGMYFLAVLGLMTFNLAVEKFAIKKATGIVAQQVFKGWWDNYALWAYHKTPYPPSFALAAYRDYSHKNPQFRVSPSQKKWPLVRNFEPKQEEVREIRDQLGLPAEGPIHIVLLFIESFRAFDVDHPEIGPEVFPRFRKRVKERGMYFSQAYTSAGIAGMTARGQFSTICSILPNLAGPGTFVAYEDLKISCLADQYRQKGYDTLWIHSLKKTYHNTAAFESKHGTQYFYDDKHFEKRGIQEKTGPYGIADVPFLKEAGRLIEAHAKKGPVFANILTIGSHHPFEEIPQGTLSQEFRKATSDHPEYRGFLSKFSYTDRAIDEFIEQIFSSPIGDRTLITVVGDHGIILKPHIPLNEAQTRELRFRVPLAFFTKNLVYPRRINYPVHQVDIAPTLARASGLKTEVTWIGRDLFRGEGSPWIALGETGISYRTQNQACYSLTEKRPRCWDVSGHRDPLFETTLRLIPENFRQTAFFKNVALSNVRVIARNLIAP